MWLIRPGMNCLVEVITYNLLITSSKLFVVGVFMRESVCAVTRYIPFFCTENDSRREVPPFMNG